MNKLADDVLKILVEQGQMKPERIAASTNYSVEKVNEAFAQLNARNYLTEEFTLTEEAQRRIKRKKPRNAVILAAGLGMRMVPIHTKVSKGLLEVDGETLIERLIKQLHAVGIDEIDIVVGFMSEAYEFLVDRYGVNLIYNPEYALKNNLHSLKLASDKLANTYVLPCDLWAKENPFSRHELYSWYAVSETTDDASTVRVNAEGELLPTQNEKIGIAYLLEKEAKLVRKKLEKYSQNSTYDDLFWEEALFEGLNKMEIYARIIQADEIIEINTYEQLRELDEHSKSLETSIFSLIVREMNVQPNEIHDIVVLKKGMTNRSFRFQVQDKQYIMRIPGEGTDQLISRSNEYNVYQRIKKAKISDDVIYMSPEKGYKITKFLKDARECDPLNPAEVKQAMHKLRAFHEMDFEVAHEFDIYGEIEFYETLWGDNPSMFSDYHETKEKVFELKPIIEELPKKWGVAHIDAVPDNFLFVGDEIRLIDWEYAGMQDVHLDLAMFAIYSLYDRAEVDALLASYFPEGVSSEIQLKMYAYIAVGGLLWSNWCEFKRLKGVEFGDYALKQYEYAKEYSTMVLEEFAQQKERD